MEERAWTMNGKMLAVDRRVIKALADNDKIASRVFITGEVHEDYIGEAAAKNLISINDVFYTNGLNQEPLFVNTMDDTVRMTRFDPNFVWRCFQPEILVDLVTEEAKRLGVKMDAWMMDHFDFYESMIAALKAEKGEFIIPIVQKGGDVNAYYNAVYLSCLLLFGKSNFMDTHISKHFSEQSAEAQLKYAKYRTLNEFEQKEVINLREQYGKLESLTNPEMNFIFSLYKNNNLYV